MPKDTTAPVGSKPPVIYTFIDASNLWEAQKAKGQFINCEGLADFLKTKFSGEKAKIFYYTAYPAEGTRPYSLDSKHAFLTFLKKGLGFAVIKKELKRIRIAGPESETIIEKGNMDVEITIDALHHMSKYDIAVLFSGDADFLALVTYLRSHGKKVFIFSSRNNISQELRTGADGYFDVLVQNDTFWGKPIKRRKEQQGNKDAA